MSAPIALTMGDPAGVGPEITVKAWTHFKDDPSAAFFYVGALGPLTKACISLGAPAPILISAPQDARGRFNAGIPIITLPDCNAVPGKPNAAAAPQIIESIAKSTRLTLSGQASCVVTNPIAKEVLYKSGFSHPGHTEFLGALTKDHPGEPSPRGPVMMLSGGGLNVALATIHIALADVPSLLSKARIVHVGQVLNTALKTYFGFDAPRIALTGLNPHAGEGGSMGTEEETIINPAAQTLRDMGINATDALPADTLFHAQAREGYDAVIAMYHDQGLIPVKTLDFHGGVNITLGLPIIRTSPDHGTAFDIAGQKKARPDSLIAALKQARQMADHARL